MVNKKCLMMEENAFKRCKYVGVLSKDQIVLWGVMEITIVCKETTCSYSLNNCSDKVMS